MADPLQLADYREALRSFLKDNADLNRLLAFKEENIDDMLDLYLNMSIGFLNFIPPLVISFDFGSFPMSSLLIHQAAIEALVSQGICNARNDLVYNNGGVSLRLSDREKYLPALQMLYRMTDLEIRNFTQLKVSINIDNGYGYASSPYVIVSGTLPIRPNSIL